MVGLWCLMIPYEAVQGYATLLGEVRAAGVADLDRLVASLSDLSDSEKYEALSDLLPDLGQRYEVAASRVSAGFFDELQDMQTVSKPVAPIELEPVGRASWQALAGWSTAGRTLAEKAANDLFFRLLSGGFTRRLTEAASDTMVENAAAQGRMRYQRVPAAGCCAFCAMLASRGGAYTSEESATQVVGRGQSVVYRRRGGVQATRPRGSRGLGQTFHDNCRCSAVAVSEGNTVDLGDQAEKYFKAYAEARDKILVDTGFETDSWRDFEGADHHTTYRVDGSGDPVSSKELTNRMAALMRKAAA
jgi:hypothetical protein